jgi:TRAP-type C4-dicarboxylate transport system substrate-binding protein
VKPQNYKLVLIGGLSLAVTLVGCGQSSDASSSGTETVRLSSYLQQDTAIVQAIDNWADKTEACANGQIEFERFYDGTLYDATNTRDAVSEGRVEVGNFSLGYHPEDFHLSEGLMSLPFMSQNVPAVMDAFQQVYEENPEAQAEWNDQGMHMMSMIVAAPGALVTNAPVETLDDLAGLDLRGSPGPINEGLLAVGANPVDLSMAEIPEAMQRGVIDGVASLIIDGATTLSLHETSQYFTEFGWGVGGPSALAVNQEWWEGLPEEVRACATDAAFELKEPYLKAVEEVELEACQAIRAEGGTVAALPEEEIEQWRARTQDDLEAEWLDQASSLVDDPDVYFTSYETALEAGEEEYPGQIFGVARCLEQQEQAKE